MTFKRFAIRATADLGEATFTYDLLPSSGSGAVGMQIFAHRDDVTKTEEWDPIIFKDKGGQDAVIRLEQGQEAHGALTVALKRGIYGKYRVLLFDSPDGKMVNWSKIVYDTVHDPIINSLSLHLEIKTETKRVKSPVLYLPDQIRDVTQDLDGTYSMIVRGEVKVPATYTTPDNGFWIQAKSDAGFDQQWASMDNAVPGGNAVDPYRTIPVQLSLHKVKPGIYNVQFGIASKNFSEQIQWVYPGLDFEAGGEGWERHAPEASIPPRLRVKNGKFVTADGLPYDWYADHPNALKGAAFVRGGNYGNSVYRSIKPALNTPEYFHKLQELGCRFMRVNFNQNRYPREPLYQHVVDQVVQNIWAAGMYPILCPQGLPDASTREDQVERGLRVVQAMATRYKGKSVWLEICNEPHEFTSWADWKPVAEQYVQAIREIDPDAFVIVPLEGFSKDGRAAAASPITSVPVDLYDAHAYIAPEQMTMLYGPMLKAHMPLLIGEYGGDADYLRRVDTGLQNLPPGLLAAGPWAFTVTGEDSLPLIQSGDGDELQFTPAGQVIANDYAAWNLGRRRVGE
jgi:hypothetical protein